MPVRAEIVRRKLLEIGEAVGRLRLWLRRDLAPRKVVPCVKRRSLDGPLRHGSSETGELVLAQNDLDHAAPASASERAWTRCPETTGGSRRASEERRDLVEGYRKPLDRRFERGQGYA